MKISRNVWRVVTLALALVMLFSVVACGNDGKETATTAAGDDTPTTTPTAPTTEKPTTEKPTTGTQDPPVDPKPNSKVFSGTPDTSWYTGDKTEYTLTTADQVIGFFELRNSDTTFEGVTIKMDTDVVYNEGTAAQIKESATRHNWYPLNSNHLFKGTFDGQGHKFSGFSFVASGSLTRGMFGSLGENAVIKNLVMEHAYFKGPDDENKNTFGLLVSRVRGLNTTISNVTVTDLLYEEGANPISSIGGLVGRVDADGAITVENCSVAGSITVTGSNVGGIIGAVNSTGKATVKGCRCLANISAASCVGGIIGYRHEDATVNVISCGSFGSLTANDNKVSDEIGSHPNAPKQVTITYQALSASIPTSFQNATTIKLAGADAKGFGIHALSQKYDADTVEIIHYYLETSDTEIAKLKLEDGTPAKKSDFYMTWEFNVTTEGDYDIGFNLRLKDQKLRENILILDDEIIEMTLDLSELSEDMFEGLKGTFADAHQNTYVTVASLHLTEGKHTLTMKISDETASSFHFRNVYLVKQTPIMIPAFSVEHFSNTIPVDFLSNDAIQIDCTTLDAGVQIWDNQSSTNHRLSTPQDIGVPSANGIVKLKIDGYYHYYVEPQFWTQYNSLYPMYARWSFEVPEEGYYDVCFNFRLKNDDQRYTQIQIDDAQVKDQYALTYKISGSNNLKDKYQNSYMTGWNIYLTAGEHTLTIRMPDYTKGSSAPSDNSCPSFHFRNIFLLKSKSSVPVMPDPPAEPEIPEIPFEETVNIIPEFGVDDFSKTKPAAFENATIVIDCSTLENGSVVMTATENKAYHIFNKDGNTGAAGHGVYKLKQGDIYHYYFDLDNVNKTIATEYGDEYTIGSYNDCYMRWTFTVTEAGTYTVGSYLRVKNNSNRVCQIQVDDQKPLVMHYTLTADEVTAVNDDVKTTQGSYLTWDGVEIELEAGEHTITYTLPAKRNTNSSWHWRTIYLMKKAA